MKDLRELNAYRDWQADASFYGAGTDEQLAAAGVFTIPCKPLRRGLRVIASTGMGWDHVSVSTPIRCPTWEEMELVKRLFFLPDETAMQLHVDTGEHISNHRFCLHIWRPNDGREIPQPPSSMVGYASIGELPIRKSA